MCKTGKNCQPRRRRPTSFSCSNSLFSHPRQTVENCVCILRNLSYRLEEEVDRNKYLDTDLDPDRPDRTIYGGPDQTTAGCFSKKSKKKGNSDQMPVDRNGPNANEGVALLWQPETLNPLLTLLADSTIAETLEAAAGMIHNLTACSWRVSNLIYNVCYLLESCGLRCIQAKVSTYTT
jgi:hypothetical protein